MIVMNQNRNLYLLLPVIFFVAVILSACEQQTDDRIRLLVANAPGNLDPRFATDAVSSRICRLLYQSLTDFDESFQPTPQLAQWEMLTPTHYRFHLQQHGRLFSDGTLLTSHDVKATYLSILDPETASPHRSSLAVINRIQPVDDDTLDFYLTHADPLFPGRHLIGILPAHLLSKQHDFNLQPVGSGPLQFQGRPDEGRLQFSRQADGQLLELLTVKDAAVRALKLARGEADLLAGDLPPELQGWLQQREDVQVVTEQGTTFSYLGFNLDDPLVGDLNIRQAIGHAIDRQAIIHFLLNDAARPAFGMFPADHWAGYTGQSDFGFDRERSITLLNQLGYDEHTPLKLIYKTSSNPFRLRLATVIQHQLKEVGIDVEIQSHDWGTFYGDIKAGRFQMYSLSWVGLKLPDIFRYVFHSESIPPAGANRGRFQDPLVDQMIDAAEHLPLNKQPEAYRQIQARLLELLPYVPLWYEDQVVAKRNSVTGYTLSADGNYDGLITVQRTL